MKASRLIELLAQNITEHGDAVVTLPFNGPVPAKGHYQLYRCWWDDEQKHIVVEAL